MNSHLAVTLPTRSLPFLPPAAEELNLAGRTWWGIIHGAGVASVLLLPTSLRHSLRHAAESPWSAFHHTQLRPAHGTQQLHMGYVSETPQPHTKGFQSYTEESQHRPLSLQGVLRTGLVQVS